MLEPNNGYDVTTHQACAETVERMTTDIVLVNPPKSQAESIYGTGCNNFDINLAQLSFVFARFHHRRHRSAVSRGLRRAARCSLLQVLIGVLSGPVVAKLGLCVVAKLGPPVTTTKESTAVARRYTACKPLTSA